MRHAEVLHLEVLQSPAVSLLPLLGAPPHVGLTNALALLGLPVQLLDADAHDRGAPRPGSAVLVWMPPGMPERTLRAVVAWSRRAAGVVLIGLAPEGTRDDAGRALESGFDDYVTGDVSPRETLGRIRALLRRSGPRPAQALERIGWGAAVLDLSRHIVEVGDRRIELTPKELQLLKALIEAGGRTLTRDQILDRVWGQSDADIETRAVDSVISRLRHKLGETGFLVTVRGVGFRLGDR
jgi:DNA-binding response OmpR family regulator